MSETSDNPFQQFTKMMEQFRIPGVDVQAMMEARRKDVEAVVQANRIAFQGAQALVQRQSEILQQTMAEWQKAAQSLTGKEPGQAVGTQAELAKQAFEKALQNMRELAELAVKAQSDAYEVIKQRVQENIEQLRSTLQQK
jgi:phasin family protein